MQQRKPAKPNPNSENPASQQAAEPFRILPTGQQPRSQQLSNGTAAGAEPSDIKTKSKKNELRELETKSKLMEPNCDIEKSVKI